MADGRPQGSGGRGSGSGDDTPPPAGIFNCSGICGFHYSVSAVWKVAFSDAAGELSRRRHYYSAAPFLYL